MTIVPDQGRARGLYDEQLQRLQQEKLLIAGQAGSEQPFLLKGAETGVPEAATADAA